VLTTIRSASQAEFDHRITLLVHGDVTPVRAVISVCFIIPRYYIINWENYYIGFRPKGEK
jgi:hypothetical protein